VNLSKVSWCLAIVTALPFVGLHSAFAQTATWETQHAAAKQAFNEHRYADAEKDYLAALTEAENFGEKDARLVTTVFDLGVLYYTQRRYDEAEPLLQRAVELREAGPTADSSNLAKAMLQLAEVYRSTRRFAKAESLYRQTLPISKGPSNSDSATTGYVYHDLGLLYLAENHWSNAEAQFLLAASIFESSSGKSGMGLGFSYLNLAHIYEQQAKFVEAETRYKQAIATFEEAAGSSSPVVASTLEGYARLLKKLNRKNEAFVVEEKAKAISDGPTATPPPVQQSDQPAAKGSLEATMAFIQDTLNSIGATTYVARAHDSVTGHDWTNHFKDEVSRLVANPAVCRVYYHWFASVEGNVTMDKDVGFRLSEVQKISVKSRVDIFNSDNAAMGHASWEANVEPPVYVLLVERPAHVENHFVFLDQDLARRVAKSLEHAVELCGGKLPN